MKNNPTYTKEKLEEAVKQSFSMTNVIRIFGKKVTGGTHAHISKLVKRYEIDTSHFLGLASNSGKDHVGGSQKKTPEEIFALVEGDNRVKAYQLNRAMVESGFEYKCAKCSNKGVWQEEKLVLEVDHIDGNWKNNLRENLRFLCPNCHSQTTNYGIKNKHSPV